MKRLLSTLLLAVTLGLPAAAHAQAVKPRFVLLLDTSSSMVENPAGTETYGDGSPGHEGCDLDGNMVYDESRLFQAKAAIADTVAAFGSAEFAFARFRGIDLGQACTSTSDCPKDAGGNVLSDVTCVNGACVYSAEHYECLTMCPSNCKKPFNPNILYRTTACHTGCCEYPNCKAGEILVPFPGMGGANYAAIAKWLDGSEGTPPFNGPNPDPEIRADV